MPRCRMKDCGYEGPVENFLAALSIYHDLCCPKCGTTSIDTSDIDTPNSTYKNNFLDLSRFKGENGKGKGEKR